MSSKSEANPLKSQTDSLSKLAAMIDHTLLKLDTTDDEIRSLCQEAIEHQFATVCVRSHHVPMAAKQLQGSSVKPITVVGFPQGDDPTEKKVQETAKAIRDGAAEIDMVIALTALKKKDYIQVHFDIRSVVEAAQGRPVKVILETSKLNEEEKVIGCALSQCAGAKFVKTSTGFGGGGATIHDVELMRRIVGPDFGVKASGGIRNREDALKMIAAGANRIGTSAGIAILKNQDQQSLY